MLLVTVIGLTVNLLSSWLLRASLHAHGRGHDHSRKAAFVHVPSDARTVGAVHCGRRRDTIWFDPLMWLFGAAVIARWSVALLRRTGTSLLEAASPMRVRRPAPLITWADARKNLTLGLI